jgi:uncharacterized protein YegP (UPF0339 family)
MNGHFVIYKDEAGEYRWRYVAGNGLTMADSAEGYTERNDAAEALETVARAIYDAIETARKAGPGAIMPGMVVRYE